SGIWKRRRDSPSSTSCAPRCARRCPRSSQAAAVRIYKSARPSWQRTRKTPTSAAENCFDRRAPKASASTWRSVSIIRQPLIFFVPAAQFFLHRDGHSGRVERNPDFAAGNGRILHDGFEKPREPGCVQHFIEPGGRRKGPAKGAAPDRATAHRAIHVKE